MHQLYLFTKMDDIHLVRKVRLWDIILLRWMYTIEQCINILKKYIKEAI